MRSDERDERDERVQMNLRMELALRTVINANADLCGMSANEFVVRLLRGHFNVALPNGVTPTPTIQQLSKQEMT